LADTRLGENLQPKSGSIDDNEASVAGRIDDAQGRFNLRNLLLTGERGENAQAGFLRMCSLLGISITQANLIIELMKQIHRVNSSQNDGGVGNVGANGGSSNTTNANTSGEATGATSPPPSAPPLLTGDAQVNPQNTGLGTLQPLFRWQDVRGAPNLSEDTWQQLKPYVVWLPQPSQVNANTASAEVLYSAMPGVDWASVQQLVSNRERVSFKDVNDIASRLPSSTTINIDPTLVSVNSQFFIVSGAVQVKQARIVNEALLQREAGKVFVVWRAES
jgi:general secretion pathway protein K